MSNKLITIIFPNINGEKQKITDFLYSCFDQNKQKVEVIMVDNGSSVSYINYFSKRFPKLKIIRNKQNLGFSKAINIGAQQSKGKYLFITNNDTILEQNCLKNLREYLGKNPNVGIVGPISYLDRSYTKIDSAIQKYTLATGLISSTITQNPTSSDWISGSGLFISKKLWKNLGGFDTNFFFYYEDIDLAIRTRKVGFNIICLPQAKIFHDRGLTAHLPQNHYFRYFNLHKSRQQLLIKHGSFWQILVGLFLQLFVFSFYHGFILYDRSVIPMINATVDNLKYSELKKNLSNRKKFKQWLKKQNSILVS